MVSPKGFTLIELMAAILIVAIATAFAVPNFITFFEQTRAQTAINNLYAISAAQSKFYEDWGAYCLNSGNPSSLTTNCADSNSDISINLKLGLLSKDPFNYVCTTYAGDLYQCTAQDGTDTLTLNVTAASGVVITCTTTGPSADCPTGSYGA